MIIFGSVSHLCRCHITNPCQSNIYPTPQKQLVHWSVTKKAAPLDDARPVSNGLATDLSAPGCHHHGQGHRQKGRNQHGLGKHGQGHHGQGHTVQDHHGRIYCCRGHHGQGHHGQGHYGQGHHGQIQQGRHQHGRGHHGYGMAMVMAYIIYSLFHLWLLSSMAYIAYGQELGKI